MSVAELDDVGEAIDLAMKVDLAALSVGDRRRAVRQVFELRAKVEALTAAVVGEYDAQRDWSVVGYRSAAAGVKSSCDVSGQEAAAAVRMARSLRHMPATAQALRDGSISCGHARRLARAAARPAFADGGEAFLLEQADALRFDAWCKTVGYWEQVVDDSDDAPDPRIAKRELHCSRTLDRMGRIDGWLDPVGFAKVEEVLWRIERELFAADWAEAAERLGERHVTTESLARTPAQRRADALVEMAERAATAPKDGKRPLPLVVVHVDADTFEQAVARLTGDPVPSPLGTERMCELDDGTVIPPSTLAGLLPSAQVARLVYEAPGVVLEYGRKVRLFTGALREAVQWRDRQCTHGDCDVPARRCEIDHVDPWLRGGATDHRNGRALCSHHHRRTNPG